MVSAVHGRSLMREMPSRAVIKNQTAEIRQHWTVGERHHRARLRSCCKIGCCWTVAATIWKRRHRKNIT